MHKSSKPCDVTRTLLVFEEAEELATQHGVVALPRADRRLLASRLQLLLPFQRAFHVGRHVAARKSILLLEARRALARLQTERALSLLALLRVGALDLLHRRILPRIRRLQAAARRGRRLVSGRRRGVIVRRRS